MFKVVLVNDIVVLKYETELFAAIVIIPLSVCIELEKVFRAVIIFVGIIAWLTTIPICIWE